MHSKTFGPPPNFIFCFNFATNYMKDLWFIYIISFKLCVFICKYAECRNDLVSNWLIPVIKKKIFSQMYSVTIFFGIWATLLCRHTNCSFRKKSLWHLSLGLLSYWSHFRKGEMLSPFYFRFKFIEKGHQHFSPEFIFLHSSVSRKYCGYVVLSVKTVFFFPAMSNSWQLCKEITIQI